MRPRFVITVMLLAGVIFAVALWPGADLDSGPTQVPDPAPLPASKPETSSVRAPIEPPVPAGILTAADREAMIRAETERMYQLSRRGDPDALAGIVNALTHAEKEIREAAIDAVKEFGDSNAVPAIR